MIIPKSKNKLVITVCNIFCFSKVHQHSVRKKVQTFIDNRSCRRHGTVNLILEYGICNALYREKNVLIVIIV